MRFSNAQTRPIAWLGSVRGGKTVGGLIALVERMKKYPGDYAVTTFGQQNADLNINPILKRILTYHDIQHKQYKTPPQRWETELGTIPIYLAGNQGSQKYMQGVTLRGAMSDEILLYPLNFIMQLIARFSHDNPWWLMTANKAEPNHWIKTEWIDTGKVVSFESNADDNPHISQSAKDWWNSLLVGKYRGSMLDNEWSSDMGLIGAPLLLRCNYVSTSRDRHIYSIWLDDARSSAIVHLRKCSGSWVIVIEDMLEFDDINDLVDHANFQKAQKLCNIQAGEPPKLAQCAFIKPDLPKFATEYCRHKHFVALAPQMEELQKRMRRWGWVTADSTGTAYKPDEADAACFACVQGVYHLTLTSNPIDKKEI